MSRPAVSSGVWGNAAGDVDPVERERFQRQVARFRPIDGCEQLKRLCGDLGLAFESGFGDLGGRIADFDLLGQPRRLIFLVSRTYS